MYRLIESQLLSALFGDIYVLNVFLFLFYSFLFLLGVSVVEGPDILLVGIVCKRVTQKY